MLDPRAWVQALADGLQAAFGPRLLYVGLQGSRLRGEAREDSDIDVVAVLDTLSPADLMRYRAVVAAQPEAEKACGFLCGRQELLCWPRHELFALLQETEDCHGALAPLLPPYTRADIQEGARIGVANLYHEVCHRYLYSREEGPEQLQGAYKAAVFALKQLYYLRTGVYLRTRRELLPCLAGPEREIVRIAEQWPSLQADRAAHPEPYFTRLICWSGEQLRQLG